MSADTDRDEPPDCPECGTSVFVRACQGVNNDWPFSRPSTP